MFEFQTVILRALFAIALLAIPASAAPILSDSFDYTNGPLVTVSAGKWTTHSGTTGEVAVVSGQILLNQSATEDVNALLDGQPFTNSLPTSLYVRCVIRFSTLPSASGEYFAHFKSSSASGFRAKIFSTTQGAAPGTFRIGIANADNSPNAIFPSDLALNTDYVLVARHTRSNAQSTVWINPGDESSFSVSDTNDTVPLTITSFAFRQSTGIGNLAVDSLVVGTNFTDVALVIPPTFQTQPQSRTITEGLDVTFSAVATGTTPMFYQWLFNGAEISGATNASISLTNVTLTQAGIYQLSISNNAGQTNSDPAVLNVQAQQNGSAAFSLVHYNVKGNFAADWTTNAPQVQAIARELLYLNPDIIMLNEIPNGFRSEMTNWMNAFFPAYNLAVSSGTDGFLRSGVISRFSIIRSNSWLDGASLTNFGYDGTFTRDLFEAEIAVPNFPQPLHVFTSHLKSGQGTDESNRRAAETRAISNYFVTGFLTTNATHPYLLTGDFNEDIARPPASNPQSIQTLFSTPTGLRLTTPINPYSTNELTHSIQNTNGLTKRYDYILPSGILFSNILSSEVFRTDLLPEPPAPLQTNDDAIASDHLPVLMKFINPYLFSFTTIAVTNQTVSFTWQSTPGQSYALLSSLDLTNWISFATNLTSSSNTLTFTTNIVADEIFIRGSRTP